MPNLANYAKAIIGALVAGLTAATTMALDQRIDLSEGIGIATVTLSTLASVWAVPNRPSA